MLRGEPLIGDGERAVDTINALGKVNGKQKLASQSQVEKLKDHIRTYQSQDKDLREEIRYIERSFFKKHAGYLIGNQRIDFQKQDGVTEIEEAILANTVECRLNDLLLQDEKEGRVSINRQPIYVQIVSNFTNFLDLSRKTLRSLEVGIPVVILGRNHTTQHSFRWVQLLIRFTRDHGIDPGMVTFLSCALDDIRDITSDCRDATGNLYATCSRSLASSIKESYPKTVASTGGPNTSVCASWAGDVPALKESIAQSAAIESAGQCTALRHCIVPTSVLDEECQKTFDCLEHLDTERQVVQKETFAGIFAKHPANPNPSKERYDSHWKVDAFIRIENNNLPPNDMPEWWRKVVVDFSKLDMYRTEGSRRCLNEMELKKVAKWVNTNQPISLAVNGTREESLELGIRLWERTGLVVNTVGSTDEPKMPPAMTCQARPQEAEIFGEFPPRTRLDEYTRFPVVIPSSNPSYDATYSNEHLREKVASMSNFMIKSTKDLLLDISSELVRGYCLLLIEYLQNVAIMNPKVGFGKERTTLWGIQRPPLGLKSLLRCGSTTSWDDLVPCFVIFQATTAREQVELSVDPDNQALIELLQRHQITFDAETSADFESRANSRDDLFHVVRTLPNLNDGFPMVGNFVSLFLPMGHIKSTMPRRR